MSKTAPGKRAPGAVSRPAPAKRLPTGRFAWRGKAIPFDRLPKTEKGRIRKGWAAKAARTIARVKREAPAPAPVQARPAGKAGRSRRDWLSRRTAWVPEHGREPQYAGMVSPAEIRSQVSTGAIDKARKAVKRAHREWVKQGKHGGGKALIIADDIRQTIGVDLAAIMPQLWWYH